MNITVFGANGRVGSQVVTELLKRGHSVTAFVHGKSQLLAQPRLRLFQGDIYDESSVSEALAKSDAVVSALGSWGTKRKDVLSAAMKTIAPIAEALGIERVVSLTGSDASAANDTHTLLHRLTHMAFSVLAGGVLHDGEAHIEILASSSLEWTVVRSPVMKPAGSKKYSLNNNRPKPWHSIPRAAVVQSMCDLVESHEHAGHAPFIHRA